MEQDAKLKALANEVMTTLFAKPKQKRLRPLVKQLTYKGVTKKWTEDGQGNFQDFVDKPKISWEFAHIEGETNIEFVQRMIDQELEKLDVN